MNEKYQEIKDQLESIINYESDADYDADEFTSMVDELYDDGDINTMEYNELIALIAELC